MNIFNKIKNYFRRSREKHKLTFINDSNYHEKWSYRVSSFNLFSLLGLYTIVIVMLMVVLLRFTPIISLFVENSGDTSNRVQVEENTDLIDSLYRSTEQNQLLIDDLKLILNDEEFENNAINTQETVSSNFVPYFSKSEADSILRYKVEHSTSNVTQYSDIASYDFFFSPVTGLVSRSIDENLGHYGVDIVTLADEPIKACLEGTVVFTGWVQSEGNIIVLQHKGDLISVYKHSSAILKKHGEKVETGDPIGIVGNSGENTTGPHLHFELWKNGQLLNPEDYISF